MTLLGCSMSGIRDNLQWVLERIERAARRSGRDPKAVRLVVVSKTVETARIREAIEAGATLLGENYVQEAQKKIEEIGRSVSWHFIGHLQSNKAKMAVRFFDVIHSLDSLALAEEVNRKAAQADRKIQVMIEVNLSGEVSKHGVEEEKAVAMASGIVGLSNLTLEGLMTLPPFFDQPELSRSYFVRLRELKERMVKEGIPLTELSMGMSGDFEVAIEEGATCVRVGTAIFGPRG
jgi:PLP dependent protein